MKKNLLKRTALMIVVCLLTSVQSFAQRFRSVQFSEAFVNEMREAGFDHFNFQIYFSTNPDSAALPARWDKSSMAEGTLNVNSSRRVTLSKFFNLYFEDYTQPEQDIYYYLISKNMVVDCGTAKAEFSRHQISINPLDVCKKIQLKSSLGRDGKPVSTYFLFYPTFENKGLALKFERDWQEKTIALEQDRHADTTMMTSTYWTNVKDIPYIIASKGAYMIKEGTYHLPEGAAESTIALDYRDAKRVKFSIKDFNGEKIDLRQLMQGSDEVNCYFQNKVSDGNILGDYNGGMTAVYNMKQKAVQSSTPIDALDFYAFPGDYIMSFWCYGGKFSEITGTDCPDGLEGIVNVNENDSVQQVAFDYGKYLTINLKSNIDPKFEGINYIFKNPNYKGGNNKLLETFYFDGDHGMTSSYTRHIKDEQGNTSVRIWPAVGYTSADIDGRVYNAEVHVETPDMNTMREMSASVPDLYKVRINYPEMVKHYNSSLYYGDIHQRIGSKSYWDTPKYATGDFTKMDSLITYLLPGTYDHTHFTVSDFSKDEDFYFSTKKQFTVTADKDCVVDLPWNKALILEEEVSEENDKMTFEIYNNDPGRAVFVDTTSYGERKQYFYVFTEAGEYDYFVKVPGLPIGNLDSFTIGDELTFEKLTVAPQYEVNVKNVGSSKLFFERHKYISPKGYSRDITVKRYADSVKFTLPAGTYHNKMSVGTKPRSAFYPMQFNIETAKNIELEVICHESTVQFKRDTVNLETLSFVDDSIPERSVRLYYISDSPYFTNELVDCNSNSVFIAGNYCAIDDLGNKVYFEIPNDKKVDLTIDFANPPVPPTGIESAEDTTVHPVIFYDLSGRSYSSPQKGLNIIRMSNGTVKKVWVK